VRGELNALDRCPQGRGSIRLADDGAHRQRERFLEERRGRRPVGKHDDDPGMTSKPLYELRAREAGGEQIADDQLEALSS